MAFTGYAFVFFFFGFVLPARWLLPARFTQPLLLVASVVFYLTWGYKLALLLAGLTAFTYVAAGQIRRRQESPATKKAILTLAVVLLLGTLATFKYAPFFGGLFGIKIQALPLPLGISFYVFEMISYVVDVYRGDRGATSFSEFALYVSYFPHLIAGPIVRASELLPQLRQKNASFDSARVSEGMFIMLTGFVKKMVIADNLATFADAVFNKPGNFNAIEVAVGVLAYTGQIFCDFSGYTDIARGGSVMLGFELPDNFDYPYLSQSITEFWRRWHMTLSRWLRDYLYIPLGGNRGGEVATYRNLLLTMTLGGLWHGARVTFILWGAYHGLLLALHKLMLGATEGEVWERIRRHTVYKVFATACTLVLVMIGWVFFRAQTFHDAASVMQRIVRLRSTPGWAPPAAFSDTLGYLGALVVLHAAGASKLGLRSTRALPPAARGIVWAAMIAMLYWFSATSPTFIYFYF